jgi:hypothetical protein
MQNVSSISGSKRCNYTSKRRRARWKIGTPYAANAAQVLDKGRFTERLNGFVENAIIAPPRPSERGQGRVKPTVAMTHEEERALREQLARLQQEHRDLDAAIAALVLSPGSDLIQVQRLKKRKLVLRDRIRAIEDQLTPDIIA